MPKQTNLLKSVTDSFNKAFKIHNNKTNALPRKGLWTFSNTLLNKKQQKPMALNPATLKRLADTDPIMWSIRRVIKGYISQTKWDIVPDTQHIESELDRWEDDILQFLNPYGIEEPIEFQSDILDKELIEKIKVKVVAVIDDLTLTIDDKKERVRWLFRTFVKNVKQKAESHKYEVKKLLEHPNDTESSFRALLELVLDDILVYDAGIIIKNYDYLGDIAELYTIPGHEVKIYRNEDRTAPQPPEAAYVWEEGGSIQRAEFTNDELIYIMHNPQQNGYGRSPLEVAAYIITASLYADEYNIEYFKHSNVPPGIINLGENVTEDQRSLFQKMWDQEVQGNGGLHKIVTTSGSDKLQFIPMRNMSNRDMQMMEYLKWAAAIKCACYGISPQDIGFVLDFHRSTSEVQSDLSQRRGIRSLLNLLESYLNSELVKSEYKFTDVKFEWQIDEKKDNIQQSQIDKIDIDSGVLSINERRKKLGMKPVDGGDRYVIKTGAGMVPVEDFERMSEPSEQPVDVQTPMASESDPLAGLPGIGVPQKPGPEAEPKVNGEPGRPTLHEQEESELNLSVNSKISAKDQIDRLNKTVEELRKKGIQATLKIGFEDKVEKDNSKNT